MAYLMFLADWATGRIKVRLSLAALAAGTSYHRRHLIRIIGELEQVGWIRVERSPRRASLFAVEVDRLLALLPEPVLVASGDMVAPRAAGSGDMVSPVTSRQSLKSLRDPAGPGKENLSLGIPSREEVGGFAGDQGIPAAAVAVFWDRMSLTGWKKGGSAVGDWRAYFLTCYRRGTLTRLDLVKGEPAGSRPVSPAETTCARAGCEQEALLGWSIYCSEACYVAGRDAGEVAFHREEWARIMARAGRAVAVG